MSWKDKSLEEIVRGVNPDGSSMLETFLQDYSREFSVKNLQPECPSCLRNYYDNYKRKINIMKSKSNYTLQARFHAIPLAIGSAIYLTNENLTDDYAERLIARYIKVYNAREEEFSPEMMFDKFPKNWKKGQTELKKRLKVKKVETPVVETPVVETPVVETPVVETPVVETEKPDEELTFSELRNKYPDIKAASKTSFLEKLNAPE